MTIEEAIKQKKPFESEQARAYVNLMYTSYCLHEQSLSYLKPFKINDQHYNILRILRGAKESMCPSDIKEVMMNKRGDLTRLIDKLVNFGWVERSFNSENRRKIDISITPKGLEKMKEMDHSRGDLADLHTRLSDEEAKQFNLFLDKMRG